LANPQRLRYPTRVTEALSFLDSIHFIPGIRAGWIERVTDLPITGDRDQAMAQLRPWHTAALEDSTGSAANWWRAEQIHGTELAVVPGSATIIAPDGLPVVPGVDGLISCQPGIVISIYVADCGAIWLADRKSCGVGLLHSGKKGTEGNILEKAITAMHDHFGTRPDDVVAVLSPCIRPPDYEVDFAADIGKQAASIGIGHFVDCGLNTASDLTRFYSYRKELGKTGRMMAWITLDPQS
jgi:copper oxidase (laccase) domain-containing protein